MMTSGLIVLGGLILYVTLYFTYGKWVERSLAQVNSNNTTPVHNLYVGVMVIIMLLLHVMLLHDSIKKIKKQ